jgi:TolA-binding protein
MSRFRSLPLAVLLLIFATALPSHAENKDILQLQVEVQQLQESVARLQQTNDESMGALKSLIEQTADSVNKMSITMNGIALKSQNQQDAFSTKSDQISGQIQSLNDSVDELKARLDKMQKILTDIQSQQQSAAAVLGNLPQTNSAAAGTPSPNTTPFSPAVATPAGAPAAPPVPVADMYRAAYADYIAAKYPLASSEFADLIKAYPDDNLSGNAYFYLGEIDSRTKKPSAAIKAYDHLLEHYPDNTKIPAAHLHKAEAMIDARENDAAARELRALIQRFPTSPEAAQARTKLATLHVHEAPADN